jgi:hypothetical protein
MGWVSQDAAGRSTVLGARAMTMRQWSCGRDGGASGDLEWSTGNDSEKIPLRTIPVNQVRDD